MPFTRLALRCMVFPFPDYIIAEAIQVPHPTLSQATLGRDRLSQRHLMSLAYLFQCDYDQLVGWANDGMDSTSLTSELPCIESGIDTDIPNIPHIMRQIRPRPQRYDDRPG